MFNYDARLYDPVIAIFLSPDSIIPILFKSKSFNRYSYCYNNPLLYSDPTGHWPDSGMDSSGDSTEKNPTSSTSGERYKEKYGDGYGGHKPDSLGDRRERYRIRRQYQGSESIGTEEEYLITGRFNSGNLDPKPIPGDGIIKIIGKGVSWVKPKIGTFMESAADWSLKVRSDNEIEAIKDEVEQLKEINDELREENKKLEDRIKNMELCEEQFA